MQNKRTRKISKKQKYYLLCYFILLFSTNMFCSTYTINSVPNPKERNTNSFVSNPDKIINQETETALNHKLLQLEKELSAEVAVVLVNSIGDAEIKTFANELFNKWEIGKTEKENGLLVLFVLDQRKVTFEVGYDLEGSIPDAISKRIQMKYMIPEFKEENYNGGILAGVEQIILRIQNEGEYENEDQLTEEASTTVIIGLSLLTLFVFLAPLWKLADKSKKEATAQTKQDYYRKFLISKKSTTALSIFLVFFIFILLVFFGFSFFNLNTLLYYLLAIPFLWLIRIAYGHYLSRKIRKISLKCNVCSSQMEILSKNKKLSYLTPQEQLEDKLQSAYHNVYLCQNCGNEREIYYDNKYSLYQKCPNCQTKAFKVKEKKTVLLPTYTSTGKEVIISDCEFCKYRNKTTRTISRRVRSSGFSTGSSGGSFSSRGSSGGSFGGGRSGGGGATSGW